MNRLIRNALFVCSITAIAFAQSPIKVDSDTISGLDARAFPDPLTVDFGRGGERRVKHLGFGAGPHLCPGAFFARTQLRVMLEELLPRMPQLRLAPGAVIETLTGATLMLKALPLTWAQ